MAWSSIHAMANKLRKTGELFNTDTGLSLDDQQSVKSILRKNAKSGFCESRGSSNPSRKVKFSKHMTVFEYEQSDGE